MVKNFEFLMFPGQYKLKIKFISFKDPSSVNSMLNITILMFRLVFFTNFNIIYNMNFYMMNHFNNKINKSKDNIIKNTEPIFISLLISIFKLSILIFALLFTAVN